MGEDDLLPDVRVGMAFGPVLSRLGDVFGTTVNRASRLTSVARPGTVLVDDALAASLASLVRVRDHRAAAPHAARHRPGHPERAAPRRQRRRGVRRHPHARPTAPRGDA